MVVFLLGLVAWQLVQVNQDAFLIGLAPKGIVFNAPGTPVFTYGEAVEDRGLMLGHGDSQRLEDLEVKASARLLSPGFYQLQLGSERVLLLTSDFDEDDFDPSQPVSLNSDWLVLERSSLWPNHFPEPNHGWVVLSLGTLSQALKLESLASQKPILQPRSQGSVWLQKKIGGEWEVLMPAL